MYYPVLEISLKDGLWLTLTKFLGKMKKIIANKAWVYIIVIEAQKFVFS